MRTEVVFFWARHNQHPEKVIARRPPGTTEEQVKAAMIRIYERVEAGEVISVRERPWLAWSLAKGMTEADYEEMRDATIRDLERRLRHKGVIGKMRKLKEVFDPNKPGWWSGRSE